MAAFLTEVKNVRLRKVSGGANTLGTSAGSGGNLMRSASDASRSRFAAGEHSFDAGAARYGDHSFTLGTARIGEKRKRTDFAGDISVDGPERSRRRFSGFTLTELSRPGSSSGLTAGAASASNSSNSSQDSQGSGSSGPFAFTRDFRQSHAWPSIARTETDLTTPSLCSDHEPEAARGAAADNSREQGTESQESLRTPPAIEMPHGHAGHVQEIIDVDAEPDSEPSRRVTHVPEIDLRAIDAEKRHEDAFARRKPTSPLPMDTPRKPLPPARARRAREVTSAADAQKPWKEDRPVRDTRQDGERTSRGSSDHPVDVSDAESDDPLTSYSPLPLTQAPPRQAERAKATTQQSRIAKATERRGGSRQVAETNATTSEGAGTSSAVRRRRTLDEELQRAGDALWAEPEDTVDGVHAEEENGELVGVGTKSKKAGFLAGGGASGIPVFMGVGYVRGAEDSREDRRQQNNTNTRRSKSRMGGD
ncbi:hypothetical protein CERSUDRAFT_87319 [Gelatoporia subvermispora B]|uniref:Uncharacterized protein n=1 Tax=Ceriporiopsis subvermispora (strain B) TaxID=914234 RepID=M2Q9F1_CERS8|nr:hypothetical protein CERSUDRAFT_87319 [Gelatoporia subvermispora B]